MDSFFSSRPLFIRIEDPCREINNSVIQSIRVFFQSVSSLLSVLYFVVIHNFFHSFFLRCFVNNDSWNIKICNLFFLFSLESNIFEKFENNSDLWNAKKIRVTFVSYFLPSLFPWEIKNNFFFLSLVPSLQLYNKISTQIWMFQQDLSQLLLLHCCCCCCCCHSVLFCPSGALDLLSAYHWLTDWWYKSYSHIVVRTPSSPSLLLTFIPPLVFCLLFFSWEWRSRHMRWCVCVCVCMREREREVVNMWGKDRVNKAVREQREENNVRRLK